MSNKSQLRLKAITGSFTSGADQIVDSHNSSPIGDIQINDLSGVFSHIASSIKRLHGGDSFSEMNQGEFNTNIIPSVSEQYFLGSESKRWHGINLSEGSLTSDASSLRMEALSGSQLIFSASLDSNTVTHKFEGAGIELTSLFPTQADYSAVGKVQDVMYNVDGSLYFGTTLLNAPYNVIKEVVKLTGGVSADTSLISNSSFAGVDLSNLPSSNREDLVDVFYNGQLLMHGTASEVTLGDADYYLDASTVSSSDLKFSFDMVADDVITVVSKYVETSAAAADIYGQVSQDHRSDQLSVGEGSGEIVTFGTGTLSAGKLYTLTSLGWIETDATDVAKGADTLVGIALGSAPADGILIKGYYHPSTSILANHSAGKAIFISTTSGEYTTVAPSGSGEFARIIGHCSPDSNIILFNPEQSWLELN